MQIQEYKDRTLRTRRRENINQLLDAYRSSGLTRTEWCSRNNIKVGTLAYWLKRERTERKGIMLKEVKLRMIRNTGLRLNAGGAMFEVGDGSDMELLSSLLKALSRK